MKKNAHKKMKKGVAFSTIAILALVGILLLSVWSYSQLATGSRYIFPITQRQPQDIALSNLELAKQFLTQNLRFSASSSSFDIAANGGTQYGTSYWYCDSKPNPPEVSEVNFALSNLTRDFLNAYISTVPNSQLSKIGVSVTNYGCTGIYDPGKANCLKQDSSNCEGFQASGTQGGTIQIKDPAQVQYTGDLAANINANRFYWIYYKLYDDTINSGLLRTIASGLRDSCTQDTQARLQFALQKTCDHYESLFAEPDGTKYVKCKLEVLCSNTANPVSCVNTPCQRPQFNQQPCWKSASQSPANQDNREKTLSAQGAAFAGIRIKITLTDTKFNIPSSDGLKPLVWILWAETQIANQECRPIDASASK